MERERETTREYTTSRGRSAVFWFPLSSGDPNSPTPESGWLTHPYNMKVPLAPSSLLFCLCDKSIKIIYIYMCNILQPTTRSMRKTHIYHVVGKVLVASHLKNSPLKREYLYIYINYIYIPIAPDSSLLTTLNRQSQSPLVPGGTGTPKSAAAIASAHFASCAPAYWAFPRLSETSNHRLVYGDRDRKPSCKKMEIPQKPPVLVF